MNGLAALPDELFHMPSLELLNVSFNPLQSLPAGVGRLAKLRNLHLAGTGRDVSLSRVGAQRRASEWSRKPMHAAYWGAQFSPENSILKKYRHAADRAARGALDPEYTENAKPCLGTMQ